MDTVKYEPFSDRFYIERKLLHLQQKAASIWGEDSLAEEYEIHPRMKNKSKTGKMIWIRRLIVFIPVLDSP